MKQTIWILLFGFSLAGCATVRSTQINPVDDSTEALTKLNSRSAEKVVVRLVDGTSFSSKSIRVRPDSTWVLPEDGIPLLFNTADVKQITFETPGKTWTGMKAGAGIGALGGLVLGLASGSDRPDQWFAMTAGQKALMGGIGLGLTGFLLGGMIAPGPIHDQFVLRNDHAVVPSANRLTFSFSMTSGNAATGKGLEKSLSGLGFGKTVPRSCLLFFCSGPTSYPRSHSDVGIRLGLEYKLTQISSVKAVFSKANKGSAQGYGGDLNSYLSLEHEVRSLEAMYMVRPNDEQLRNRVAFGAGFGLYRPAVDIGSIRRSSLIPGLVLEASARPFDTAVSFELSASYRMIRRWKLDAISLQNWAGESETLTPFSIHLRGFLVSAGVSIRF